MDETRFNSRLRYVDADDLDDSALDLDDLDIKNDAGEKIGDVEGFVVDSRTGRPYYVAVDSGGWFSGGHYLLPVGRTRLERDADGDHVLRADLDKEAIKRFPEFDHDTFASLPDDRVRLYEQRIIEACVRPGERSTTTGEQWDYDRWSEYRQPEWWHAQPGVPGQFGTPVEEPPRGTRTTGRTADEMRGRDESERPFTGERAQPGDILGIERGGETTGLGDTGRDEEKRLTDEEEAARKQRRER